MATLDQIKARASGIAIPTATSTSPVASQTANLRASQAATNAQLAAQNAAVTASSNPRVTSPVQQAALSSAPTVSGNKTPTATAAQLAALRNTYVNSQPVQTTPTVTSQLQQKIGAAQQASSLPQTTPTTSQLQQRIGAAQQAASVSKLQNKYGTEEANRLQQIIGGGRAAALQPAATTAAAASTPAAETPAAEAPKATMYTPTTLAAKSASTTAPAATPAATPASTVATQTATTTAAKPAATATPAATTASAVTNSPAATTTKSNSGSESVTQNAPVEYTPTGMYDLNNLRAYNEQRVADIRSIYDDALRANLASMQRAYDQNMSDAEAARDLISPQYQRSMNSLSAEYERQRRNNNMQAAANGLNTGAGSQMALAQSANYQANQAGLAAKENEALNEANRRIGDLQRNYQNAIAEATANNNYKLAASLMEEYQNAYNRQLQIENTNYQRAQQTEQQNYTRSWNEDERSYSRGIDEAGRKAQYGDFSGYKDIYGDEIANLMELTWAMQNPDVAWASGKLSAEDYQALTGNAPNNPTATETTDDLGAGSGISGSGIFGGSLGSYSGGGGYSSGGRSGGTSGYGKGYNGPPGYLNTDGQFVVPGSSYGNYANTTAAAGHEADKARADAYASTYASTGNLRAATAAGNDAAANGYSGGSYTGGGSSGGGSSGGGGTTQTWSEKVSDALSNVPIIGNLFK